MAKKKLIRDTFKIMIKNWKKLSLIIAFDILFVLLLINLRFVLANLNVWFYSHIYQTGAVIRSISSILFIIIILLLLIAIYAFFKYIIMNFVEGMFKKTEFEFYRFFSFLKINFLAFIPIIFIFIIFFIGASYFLKNLMANVGNPLTIVLIFLILMLIALILFIYSYTLLNLFHFIFLKEKKLKKIIKHAFINSFKIRSYKLYWSDIKIIIPALIVLLFIYIFMKFFVLKDFSAYLKYYGLYRIIILSILLLVGYFLVLFNRINFYIFCVKAGD